MQQFSDFYLNPEQAIRGPMPDLLIEKPGVETTSSAGVPSLSYCGPLAKWNVFEKDVHTFINDPVTQEHLRRCQDLPVYPNPRVEHRNSHVSTREQIQVGAEITLSGRFFERAIVPVVASVETLTDSTLATPPERPAKMILPTKARFGDSWVVPKDNRPDTGSENKIQPDIVAKLCVNDDDQVRLVGELKFCTTVDLEDMYLAAFPDNGPPDPKPLREILG